MLLEGGEEVARASPPPVDAVDGTAAGDAFCAALLVSLLDGRGRAEALRRACAAGALAASQARRAAVAGDDRRARRDTRTSMTVPVLIDCDPGHDDAIALLLALASPELDVLGVTTVCGNSTLEQDDGERDPRARVRRPRETCPVAAGADRPLVREAFVAAYVHGESGMDGPALPPPSGRPSAAARRRLPRRAHSGLARSR